MMKDFWESIVLRLQAIRLLYMASSQSPIFIVPGYIDRTRAPLTPCFELSWLLSIVFLQNSKRGFPSSVMRGSKGQVPTRVKGTGP